MFVQSNKVIMSANRLAARNFSHPNDLIKVLKVTPTVARQLHTTVPERAIYVAAAPLPLPNNIDAAESTRFSPQRSRDISANVILSQQSQMAQRPSIDITADNTTFSAASQAYDPHVASYDCFGAVSLNSVMQSNVPQPFGGMHKFSHLNMPGGQWSQEGKFTSQNLHSSHYRELRNKARSDWTSYDQDATVDKKAQATTNNVCLPRPPSSSSASSSVKLWNSSHRSYSTAKPKLDAKEDQATDAKTKVASSASSDASKPQADAQKASQTAAPEELSKKEQLKRAFKEYGATIVVFHVAISLASLGGFYALVSSGIDMMAVLEKLNMSSTVLANKVAAGGSTFVIAYAIHKVFAPARISITLGATPFIVRYLRSKGFLKPKNIEKKVK